MYKTHFRIRFRINHAAHDLARTAIFILLVDPPDGVQTLEFRNDTPEGLPWSLELRTHRPVAAVKVDILSDKRTDKGDPTVWIEAEWDGRGRRCQVCADIKGQIRHREVFEAGE